MYEPQKLNPEVKWKTVVSMLLNYLTTVRKVLDNELGEAQTTTIINKITLKFWEEQSQAIIDLFGLKKGSLEDAHSVKRILATILDISFMPIKSDEHEIIDGIKTKFCPIRVILEPIWPKICDFCGLWGQIMINQLDSSFKHKVVLSPSICKHITSKKT